MENKYSRKSYILIPLVEDIKDLMDKKSETILYVLPKWNVFSTVADKKL